MLLPTPGVLGSLFWSSMSVWLAVPTSIVAACLLPFAYYGFLRLQLSRAYLGAERPTGVRGGLWLAGIGLAMLVMVAFLGVLLVDELPGFLERVRSLFSSP